MLPPTSERLRDPDTVPYFLWDTRMTVADARRVLAGSDAAAKDEVVLRILREANSRDAWLFLDWPTIEEAWPRIEHRLGRARPVWRMMLDRRHEHLKDHGSVSSAP